MWLTCSSAPVLRYTCFVCVTLVQVGYYSPLRLLDLLYCSAAYVAPLLLLLLLLCSVAAVHCAPVLLYCSAALLLVYNAGTMLCSAAPLPCCRAAMWLTCACAAELCYTCFVRVALVQVSYSPLWLTVLHHGATHQSPFMLH
jgi:hypothetical protein